MDNDIREIDLNEIQALQAVIENDEVPIWVSWFSDQGFCEYSLCIKSQGIITPRTPEQQNGIDSHKYLEELTLLTAQPIESLEVAVEEVQSSGIPVEIPELSIGNSRLVGRIDRIIIRSNDVWVIDYKQASKLKSGEPFFGQQRQSFGYATLFAELYPQYYTAHRKIYAGIADVNTRKRIWHKPLTEDRILDVHDTCNRIKMILRDPNKAVETKYPTKCAGCTYGISGVCDRIKY